MKRKVVQHGPHSLGISLPNKWATKKGITKGDEIDIEEQDGFLIIGPNKKNITESKVHVPDKHIPEDKNKLPNRYAIRTIVINALRKGHDKITITYDSPKVLAEINNCVNEVLGYEIVEQGKNECIIENVVNIKEAEFEKQYIKFRYLIGIMLESVTENILKNEKNIDEINSHFFLIEKNYNSLCRFLMNESSEKTREKIFTFESLGHLYQAARNLYYASKINSEQKIKFSNEGKNLIKKIFRYIKDILEFYRTKDLCKIADFVSEKNKVTYYDLNYLLLKGGSQNQILVQLSFSARRMWDSVGPYVGSII